MDTKFIFVQEEVYPYIWDIGLDGMIGGNGSYVEDNGHVVMHQLITKEQCKHIVDWLKESLSFTLKVIMDYLQVKTLKNVVTQL